jgi:hypothetical protein
MSDEHEARGEYGRFVAILGTGVAQSVEYLTTDGTAGVRSPAEAKDFL